LDALILLRQAGGQGFGSPAHRLEPVRQVNRGRKILVKANVVNRILRKSINAGMERPVSSRGLARPGTGAADPVDQGHRVGGHCVPPPGNVLIGA
jgi:hypothetical protein